MRLIRPYKANKPVIIYIELKMNPWLAHSSTLRTSGREARSRLAGPGPQRDHKKIK